MVLTSTVPYHVISHPVSVRRFPSFRTQPLESLTSLSMNKWVPEQPSPWRNSSKRESCYGDRVHVVFINTWPATRGSPTRLAAAKLSLVLKHSVYIYIYVYIYTYMYIYHNASSSSSSSCSSIITCSLYIYIYIHTHVY